LARMQPLGGALPIAMGSRDFHGALAMTAEIG
jgi:hypothetical protein